MAMAVVMADQLLRRRRVVLPPGFAIWAVFLAWVGIGVFVLWANAPSAIPNGGPSRLIVFGYRGAWYLTATVMLVWVANLKEHELPTRWLYQLLGSMFVVTTVGGLAGVLFPTFEFPSLIELVLPRGLRANSLVQSITSPALADIQNVLGRPVARPKAPFPFANSWGASVALFLPFFLVAWWRDGARWQRVGVPIVLVASSVPIVFSLNRGLWICLALGVVGYLLLQVRHARLVPIVVALGLLLTMTLAFFVSPLGTIFEERLANAHSNERRGLLLTQTVVSATEGSPIVGFGSTRDVQGSFSSIAGADTPDCGACGLPPLGTQGHLWLVIFSQGLVGALLFLSFFLIAFQRSWRCRTTTETLCTFILVFFSFQLFIYDTLGLPLIVVMIAIGAVWREQVASAPPGAARLDARESFQKLRTVTPFLLALVLLGSVAGAGVHQLLPTSHTTRVSVLLNEVPVHVTAIDTQVEPGVTAAETTVDTEAGWITSDDALSKAAGTTDDRVLDQLRSDINITAAPNTRVIFVEVRRRTAAESRRMAGAVVRSYLAVREASLTQRQDIALAQVEDRRLNREAPQRKQGQAPDSLPKAVAGLVLTPRTAGRVINTGDSRPVKKEATVLIASGAALGLALGALLLAGRPNWTPTLTRSRRRSR